MTLYHVTLLSSLPSILVHGLIPSVGPRSRERQEEHPAVYFFRDRPAVEDALGNWLGDALEAADGSEEPIAILEVDVITGVIEAPSSFEACCLTPVPASSIIRAYDESWGLMYGCEPARADDLLARPEQTQDCSNI